MRSEVGPQVSRFWGLGRALVQARDTPFVPLGVCDTVICRDCCTRARLGGASERLSREPRLVTLVLGWAASKRCWARRAQMFLTEVCEPPRDFRKIPTYAEIGGLYGKATGSGLSRPPSWVGPDLRASQDEANGVRLIKTQIWCPLCLPAGCRKVSTKEQGFWHYCRGKAAPSPHRKAIGSVLPRVSLMLCELLPSTGAQNR